MTDTQGSTHTPGPWQVEGKIVAAIIDKGNGRREVRAILEMIEGHQTEANTKLVTAAPELLVALRRLIMHSRNVTVIDATEEAAIGVATELAEEAVRAAK